MFERCGAVSIHLQPCGWWGKGHRHFDWGVHWSSSSISNGADSSTKGKVGSKIQNTNPPCPNHALQRRNKKIRKGRQIQHKAASTSKILDLRNSYVVEV
jgi:hypothetical protein